MRQELEFVCSSSSLVENREEADVFVVKLLLGLWEVEIGGIQPYLIAYAIIACGALLLIVLCFHVVSSLFKSVASFLVDLGHGRCEFGGCRICEWRRSGRVRENSGILSVEHHEGDLACHAVNLVVMGELSKQEPIAPVGLSVVDEDLKVLLDLLINLFGLSIGLWVECSGGVRHDVKHSIEFLHELRDELWSSIGDHGCQHSVSCIDMVVENSGPFLSGELDIAGYGDDGFRELVYDHEESIVST